MSRTVLSVRYTLWAILTLSAATLLVIVGIMRHWQGGGVRTVLVFPSLATTGILLHGGIDALALGLAGLAVSFSRLRTQSR
jgi:hypothetical protein